MYAHAQNYNLSSDVVSMLLSHSTEEKEQIFASDPLTSPYEFKKEVVQWLKQSEGCGNLDCPPQPSSEDLQTFYEFIRPMHTQMPCETALTCNTLNMNVSQEFPKYANDIEVISPTSTLDHSLSPPYMPEGSVQANHPLLIQFLQNQQYKCTDYPTVTTPQFYNCQPPDYPYQYHPYLPPVGKDSTTKLSLDRPLRSAAGQLHKNSVCSNCKTTETPLWRWNVNGEVECNACNIYQARNNRKRPVSLRKDKILRRKRHTPKVVDLQ